MTPNQITTLLAAQLDQPLEMPLRLMLMERVKNHRARQIKQALDKRPSDRKFFRQSLYMSMQKVLDTTCAPLVACQVARSAVVPRIIRSGPLFDYVGGIDGNSPFQLGSSGVKGYLEMGRFSEQFPTYEFIDECITVSKADLPLIRIDGIFDDPMSVQALNCGAVATDCDNWNTEFPISRDLLQLVIQLIIQIDYNRMVKADNNQIEV